MIANWDGQSLALCESQKAASSTVFIRSEHDDMDLCELMTTDDVTVPLSYLLFPLEQLLVRQVSFDLPHVKLVDQAILGNEIAESCDEDASQWWLSAMLAKREERITGVLLALADASRDALTQHPVWQSCRYVLPDVWVRLLALLPQGYIQTIALLDEDEAGLCLGIFDAQGCLALRRINHVSWRDTEMLAQEIQRSLHAMHAQTNIPLLGTCGTTLHQALASLFTDCQVQASPVLTRAQANIQALQHALRAEKTQLSVANLRHGTWSSQQGIQVNWRQWRVVASLVIMAFVVLCVGQRLQVQQLKAHNHQIEQAIEMHFRAALPDRPQNYEPLAQLRQAAGQVRDVDAWYFLEQLQAIASTLKQWPDVKITTIQLKNNHMFLAAEVKDFASVTRVQETLSQALGVTVHVDDTELNAQKRVRFRMKWS